MKGIRMGHKKKGKRRRFTGSVGSFGSFGFPLFIPGGGG